MKKTLFYCAAFLALASCAKNEVTELQKAPVNSDVIGFNASTNVSRAADNGLAAVKGGFNVIGLDKDGATFFTKDDAIASPVISSEYKYDDQNTPNKWIWTEATEDKKWPKGDVYPLQFIAAYPKVGVDVLGPWVSGGPVYEQDITVGATIDTNIDLLAANNTTEGSSKPVTGTTKLTFKHILSKIKFQIITPENYTVVLQQITIKNVAKAGRKYDYKASTYSAEATPTPYTETQLDNFAHLLGTEAGLVTVTGAANEVPQDVTNFTTGAASGQTWKLLPQTTTGVWEKGGFESAYNNFDFSGGASWSDFLADSNNKKIFDGAHIELVYRMEDNNGKSIVGWKKDEVMSDGNTQAGTDLFVQVAYPLDLSAQANKNSNDMGWLPGFQYTYQIKLGTPDATNGTVTKPDFTKPDGGNTDIPVDNPAVKPGEDITKDGYIDFDVTVDEWTENSGTIIK